MRERQCRERRRTPAGPPPRQLFPAPMEREDMPMNRYINPIPLAQAGAAACRPCPCPPGAERALLEQLVELSASRNQLLVDLLGAVNALTAATLTANAKV